MPAPISLIVNPVAGGGRAARIAGEAETTLRGHGLTLTRADTQSLEHARELAVEGAGSGRTVVAVSGDGMVGAIADSLRHIPGAVLGLIPGGRGNDLARVLGIPPRRSRHAKSSRAGTPARSTSASWPMRAAPDSTAPSWG